MSELEIERGVGPAGEKKLRKFVCLEFAGTFARNREGQPVCQLALHVVVRQLADLLMFGRDRGDAAGLLLLLLGRTINVVLL
jgi:hypothetical protein